MTDIDSGEELRNLARNLFAQDEPDEPAPPDPATANVVPGEGNNPTEPGHDLHTWVAALFDTTD